MTHNPENPQVYPLLERLKAGNVETVTVSDKGMTLRDYFAGQALAGYFANPSTPHQNACGEDEMSYMYETADAMLKERAAK